MQSFPPSLTSHAELPSEQRAIRDRCYHPSGAFTEFGKEDVEHSIPERFEKIVRHYPDRPAVVLPGGEMSYSQLNEAANRFARAILESLGAGAEPVILFSEHDLTTLIACLGIFKAGKILIAVDPSFPAERIAHIREDAGAAAILTGGGNRAVALQAAQSERQVLTVEGLSGKFSTENLGLPLSPAAPAEIRYSSGSTGRPKGILRSHRRLLQSARLVINGTHVCSEDRLLILRNLSYGTRDVLKGLFSGAALVPFDVRKEGLRKLANFVTQQQITCYTSVSSTFRYLVDELDENQTVPSVRLIQLGGETLSKRDVESYRKHFDDHCILLQRFSCGEAGNLCQYFIDKQTQIDTAIVPVGYPVEGKKVFLLDDNGAIVPFGQIGEIAVQSRYLSSEYWRNPELTAAKFLPDPAGGEERVYLTGDLGRLLPDGCLVHLGRKDLEVKIRGFKVALPEIETALREFPRVKDAAVKALDRESGETCLAAYVVAHAEPCPTQSEIHDFLKPKLPSYMIPSLCVPMPSLPLVNGKVDRSALPLPDRRRRNVSQSYEAPRNAAELALVQIWEAVLAVRPIGIHDGFLESGGNSLLATQVVSRVLSTFNVDLPVSSLLESATVAAMASQISRHRGSPPRSGELSRILAEVDALSEEEAGDALARKKGEKA